MSREILDRTPPTAGPRPRMVGFLSLHVGVLVVASLMLSVGGVVADARPASAGTCDAGATTPHMFAANLSVEGHGGFFCSDQQSLATVVVTIQNGTVPVGPPYKTTGIAVYDVVGPGYGLCPQQVFASLISDVKGSGATSTATAKNATARSSGYQSTYCQLPILKLPTP